MIWNFYLDESGQSKSTTPHAVFGGFGIAADKEEEFLEAAKALFKDCYGVVYDGTYELKGTKIFEWDKIKHIEKYPDFSDEERQQFTAELMSNSPNSKYTPKKKAALAFSGLKFAYSIIILLEMYECKLVCAFARYGTVIKIRGLRHITKENLGLLYEGDNNYVTRLLNELEYKVYEDIFKFSLNKNIKMSNIYADKSEIKADELRLKLFKKSIKHLNNNIKFKLNHNISIFDFKTLESKDFLQIQISDIIIYILNWALVSGSNNKINNVIKNYIDNYFLVNKNGFFKNSNISHINGLVIISNEKPQSIA